MAKSTFILLFLLCSVGACTNSKQDIYYSSCYDSFFAMNRAFSSLSESKLKEVSKETCAVAKAHWDKEGWDQVGYPKYQGCINAAEMLYADPVASSKKIDTLKKNFCSKYLN